MFRGSVWVARGFFFLAWLVVAAGVYATFQGLRGVSAIECRSLSTLDLDGACRQMQSAGRYLVLLGDLVILAWALLFFWLGYMLRMTYHQTAYAGAGANYTAPAPVTGFIDALNARFVQGVQTRTYALLGAAVLVASMMAPWGFDVGFSRGLGRPALAISALVLLLAFAVSKGMTRFDDAQLDFGLSLAGLAVVALVSIDFIRLASDGREELGWGIWLAMGAGALWAAPSLRSLMTRLAPVLTEASVGTPMPAGYSSSTPPAANPAPAAPAPAPGAYSAVAAAPATASPVAQTVPCFHCGTPLALGIRFCTNCGQPTGS